MKKASKIIVFTVITGLSVSAFAFGGSDKGRHGADPMKRLEHMAVMLDLTESQVAQLKPVFEQQEDRHSAKGSKKGLMKSLHTAIENGAGTNEINAIADQAADQARERVLKRAEVIQAVQNVLTDEQKMKAQEFRELRERRHAKFSM